MNHDTHTVRAWATLPLASAAMMLTGLATAHGAAISITNHSFEDDVIPRNGNPANQTANSDDWFLTSSSSSIISGWTIWDDGRNDGNNANYFLVSAADDSFWNAQLNNTPEADANDQAFGSAERDIYQELATTLVANTTYTMTIDIGNRVGGGNAGNPGTPEIYLGYGSTPGVNYLISIDNASLPAQIDGDWVKWSGQFTTGASPVGEGQALRVELNNGSNVGWFDNVRLDATPIPEPSAAILLAAAGVGLFRRKRG